MNEITAGRAYTPAQKREIIERLLLAWTETRHLRLGQLIVNACGPDPYHVEDYDLIRKIEALAFDATR